MWIESSVFKEDMEQILHSDFIPWEKLEEKTIFITGATGLIGYYLVSALMYRNLVKQANIRILALVRDLAKAQEKFATQQKVMPDKLSFIVGDLNNLPTIEESVDYIVHAGGPTASYFFVEKPVETLTSMGVASMKILEMAQERKCKGMVYISSMEVYGEHRNEFPIIESEKQILDSRNLRDCYPISKCFVENACMAYFQEYGLPVNVLRLSQTLGVPKKTDNRIVAEIVRCILEKKDIILKTRGDSKRTYLYVTDAVTAILTILAGNTYGQIYNASCRGSFCSIWDLAHRAANNWGNGLVHILSREEATSQYPKTNYLNLSSKLLEATGWKAQVDLDVMLNKIIVLARGKI